MGIINLKKKEMKIIGTITAMLGFAYAANLEAQA